MNVMVNRNLIGCKSREIRIRIEEEQVRRYTQAVGIPYDGEVPPTFAAVLAENVPEIDLHLKDLIHVEQNVYYYGPLMIGDVVTCAKYVTEVYDGKSALGSSAYIVLETKGVNPVGEILFLLSETYMILKGDDVYKK